MAAQFEAKLKRARQKGQYIRIQACTLAEAHPEVALLLLEKYFEQEDRFDEAQAFVGRATVVQILTKYRARKPTSGSGGRPRANRTTEPRR